MKLNIYLNLFLFLVNIKELGTAPAGSHRVTAGATYWYNVTTLQHLSFRHAGPSQGTESRAAGPVNGSATAAQTLSSDGYPPKQAAQESKSRLASTVILVWLRVHQCPGVNMHMCVHS